MKLQILLILTSITLPLLLSACGGGGGGGDDSMVMNTPPVVTTPVNLPSDSQTYENPDAIDPLPSFKAVQLPTSSKIDYRRTVPENAWILEATPYVALGFNGPDDTLPLIHRAFKLWTRRIDGLLHPGNNHQRSPHIEPGTGGKVSVDLLIGYPRVAGGNTAGSNHYGDSSLEPLGRSSTQPVVIFHDAFFNSSSSNVINSKLTADGFRVIAHEIGHIFNYTAPNGHYHGDCDGVGIMCTRWSFNDELSPVGPAELDFEGIRHHYGLRDHTDHEEFGIWATVRNPDSDLNEFGVQVTRTLIANSVISNNRRTTQGYIEDRIRIDTMISGTASDGPVTGMGTATWSGDLIAVDTNYFQPVLGDANLSMDLSTADSLEASFTNLHRTDNAGALHSVLDLAYTLMRTGDTWADTSGAIAADFYAVGTDNIGAVAGRLDDETRNLMGAFGALRDP